MKKYSFFYISLLGLLFISLNILLISCSKDRRKCNDPTEPYYCGKWDLSKVCSSTPYVFVGTPYNSYTYTQVGFSSMELCSQYSSYQYQYQSYDCKSCYIENQ